MKRYRFVGYFGTPKGIPDTDDLKKAIDLAIEFQCEIFDTLKNDVVFSVWDGWNKDWMKNFA